MCCRSAAPRPATLRTALTGLLAAVVAASCTPDFGVSAFLCSSDPRQGCPRGYHCNMHQCVRDGQEIPVLVTSNLALVPDSFTVHERDDDVVLCWKDSLEARTARISAVAVSASGVFASSPRELFAESPDSPTTLTGWAASCGVIGRQVITVPIRPGLGQAIVQRYFATALESEQPRMFAPDALYTAMASFAVPGMTQYSMGAANGTAWMVYPHDAADIDARQYFHRTTIGADLVPRDTILRLPVLSTTTFVATTRLLVGTGGAWLAASLTNGDALLAWIDDATTTSVYVDQQVPPAWLAVPFAVRGRELAIAYRVASDAESTTWQLNWVAPSTDAARPEAAAVRVGPRFAMGPGVTQPGSYLNTTNDQLVIAGSPADRGRSNTVTLWTVPWGDTREPTVFKTLAKDSALWATRLALAHRGAGWQVFWAENDPGRASTSVAHLLLYAGAVW